MSVRECCRTKPVMARSDESVREAAQRMELTGVGCVVVVDAADHPIGMLTDRDLVLRVLRREKDPEATQVGEVMSQDVISVRERSGLSAAFRAMRREGLRRLPVVDDGGALTGVLAWDDAVRLIAQELTGAAAAVARQAPDAQPAMSGSGG